MDGVFVDILATFLLPSFTPVTHCVSVRISSSVGPALVFTESSLQSGGTEEFFGEGENQKLVIFMSIHDGF